MTSIENLVKSYESYVRLRWEPTLAGPQKVWFAVYDKLDERRLRARMEAFETATQQSGHAWYRCDVTDLFPQWMAQQDYKDQFFESPEDMDMSLEDFALFAIDTVRDRMAQSGVDEQSVFAINGLGALFGLMSASRLIESVAANVRGRLLVFFPGERDDSRYRLLDANDGWNYHGIPITAEENEK